MPAPSALMVQIACPHCGTRYQVAREMLGVRGRQVSCAHCGETWKADPVAADEPEPDVTFSDADEEALDAVLAAAEKASRPATAATNIDRLLADAETPPEIRRSIEEIRAALAPRPKPEPAADPAAADAAAPEPELEHRRIARAFERRLRALARRLPTYRIRWVVRATGLCLLAALVAIGLGFRVEVVRALPAMAGVYAAIGLGVNVVGLDFADVKTLLSRHDGLDVLSVSATIHSVESHEVKVPPVVVTVSNGDGGQLYQWSVTPDAGELEPGETLDFATQLTSPPPGARDVTLSFSDQPGRPLPVAAHSS
ncbi:MAG TPA: MJ0042-type zinc finger domain-containing protein [Alphaproteobacteria bacterium]|nr:MJ0042-type zinc finger domain-containing protein [Alphaproteobacteria bacterium]